MWTPRRLLLLFTAIGLSAGGFYAYAVSSLGRIDGLPQLPAGFAVPADDNAPLPPQTGLGPADTRLVQAFGPKSQEVTDLLAYKLRFEDREKGLVFAAGQPEFGREASRFVKVSPFSVGFFAEPKPKAQMAPGEVQEITTFHADECQLQFDKEVAGPQDITKAKIVGMELKSKPDMATADPRRGRVWVTNNQRSANPDERLLFRTPGPLFYQAPDADPAKPPPADAPQVWTAGFVEVIDCRNLPRPLPAGTEALPVIPGDALRGRGVVADMVGGASLPPPTMTATGMKIYLRPKGAVVEKDKDKRNASGYSGVRLIELVEKVQVNLWTDGSAGLPGGGAPPAGPKPNPGLPAPLAGGLADGVAMARKLADKSLLVIESTGAFRYDFQANSAKFETSPAADPNRRNDVAVTRIGSLGRYDDLACKQLVVEFFGGPDKTAGPKTEGMAIKALTATGPHVYLSVEGEGFSAQGQYLNYRTDPAARTTVTVLRGSPVVAKKERNRLLGGSDKLPAEIVLTTLDPPPPPPGQKPGEKSSLVEVRGPGRMEMFDPASNDNTLSATWQKRLIQEKVAVGAQVQDLMKFEGNGKFEDVKAKFDLTADDKLWLWLAPDKKGGGSALPQRLLAVQNVRSVSPELEVGMAGQPPVDQLTVWFRDGEPPAPTAKPVAPLFATPTPGAAAPPAPPPAGGDPRRPAEPAIAAKPEPKKQPVLLSARAVESWVLRYPLPADPKKPTEPAALKYEMERARCEDRVVVHQEPADPTKVPRGLDIAGQTLNLTQSRAGSVMVVTGTPMTRAEVHFETTSITGPTVKIDQPNNAVEVAGAGTLRMPSQQDFGGPVGAAGPTSRATELEVSWSQEMHFEGANAAADFLGAVKAVQTPDRGTFRPKGAVPPPPRVALRPGERAVAAAPPGGPAADPTWSRTAVFCHRMDVSFDRPVYFSQMRRPDAAPGKQQDAAKLRRAVCTPKPDDEVATTGGQDRTVVYLEETLDRATRKLTKAQRIECKELEMQNDDPTREQRVYAVGEGEVRILQAGSKDGFAGPAAGSPAGGGKPAAGEEMKLTWVKFATRMTGVDKAKLFQSATFDNGARVWQTPTDDLNLVFEPSAPPPGTVQITCEDKLEVTSEKLRPDAPADQRLVATGSAEALTDEYRGAAPVIRFRQDTTTFEGTDAIPASFQQLKVGINQRNYTRGRQLVYHKDGRLDVTGGTTGSFAPGGR